MEVARESYEIRESYRPGTRLRATSQLNGHQGRNLNYADGSQLFVVRRIVSSIDITTAAPNAREAAVCARLG